MKYIKELIKELITLKFPCEEENYIGPILEKRPEVVFESFNR